MDKAGRQVPCFVQVNIGAEEQKGGCAIADLPALLAEARAADLPLAGLMCVPPAGIEAAPFFALLDKLARDHGLAGRSMGMSDDFETAILLGATHVRVGSALFGATVLLSILTFRGRFTGAGYGVAHLALFGVFVVTVFAG